MDSETPPFDNEEKPEETERGGRASSSSSSNWIALFLVAAVAILGGVVIRMQAPFGPQPATAVDVAQCLADLEAAHWQFTPVPDKTQPGGCGWSGAVRLRGGPVVLTAPVLTTCAMARGLAQWEPELQQAAEASFGARIRSIQHLGAYNCRPIRGRGDRLSEHARADALDVSGFTLTDGRKIVVQGRAKDDPFLKRIADAACRHFRVVLGPGFNSAHANHLHLDQGPFRSCR